MNLDILAARAKIVSAIRRFFDERGFIEVETAVRIPAPAPEEHIDCPIVLARSSSVAGEPAKEDITYLRASPELQMKKLLAEGMDKIYQIGPCFREGEKGSRHNPEFTMLEWYRKNATYLDIKDDLENLLNTEFSIGESAGRSASQSPSSSQIPAEGGSVFKVLKVRDAYLQYAGWDPWEGAWDQDRFDFDMATKIEPAIKSIGGGVFLMDYPSQAASLAKLRGDVAERWEFYWDGLELANCFTELCDSGEQRTRFEAAKKARILLKESDYHIDSEFIECLPRIGSAAGVALGVDRLVMILTKTKEISAVRASL